MRVSMISNSCSFVSYFSEFIFIYNQVHNFFNINVIKLFPISVLIEKLFFIRLVLLDAWNFVNIFVHVCVYSIIIKSLDHLRAKETFIRKKLGLTMVSAIKDSSVTL